MQTLKKRIAIVWYVLTRLRRSEFAILLLSVVVFVSNIVAIAVSGPGLGLTISLIALTAELGLQIRSFLRIGTPTSSGLKLHRVESLPNATGSREISLAELSPNFSDESLGYQILRLPNDEVVAVSKHLDRWIIREPSIRIRPKTGHERQILQELRVFWDDFHNFLILKANEPGRLFNETKLALISRLSPDDDFVDLGKTTYFTSLVTNEASMYVMKRDDKIQKDFRLLYPYISEELPVLQSLEGSGLSNHIGVNMLAMSADNFLVCWVQNNKAQQNVGELVPTAAGSLDWHDVQNSQKNDLLGIIRYGMARELYEEAQLDLSLKTISIQEQMKQIMIIGYFRWLPRGAKPEFVGIANVNAKLHELTPDVKEVQKTNQGGKRVQDFQITSVSELLSYCNYQLEQTETRISIPLAVILMRLRSILRSELGEDARTDIIRFWHLRES